MKPPIFALLVVAVLAAVLLASPVPKKKAHHHGSPNHPHHSTKQRHPRSTDDADYGYAFPHPFQLGRPYGQYGIIRRGGAYYPPIGPYPLRGGPYAPLQPVVVPYKPSYNEYGRPVESEEPSVVPGPVDPRPRQPNPLPMWYPLDPAVEGPYPSQVEPSDREGMRLTPLGDRAFQQGSETARRILPASSVDSAPRQIDYSDYGHKDRAKKDAPSIGSTLLDALKLLR
ncbi:hypothetical protein AAVH_07573 [Aphelenchoides avenae]|nr:hypothetical protein AAVH_07573 [Aphelenchus avenae]